MLGYMGDSHIFTKCGVHPMPSFRKKCFSTAEGSWQIPCQDCSCSGAGICRLILVLFSSCLSVLVLQVKGCAVDALCVPPPHCNLSGWWSFRVEIPGMSPDIQTLIRCSASVPRHHNIVFSLSKGVIRQFKVLNRDIVSEITLFSYPYNVTLYTIDLDES